MCIINCCFRMISTTGTQLTHETPLINMPTSVCTFMMDTSEPAVAVASDTFVYIYKTIRPYFKFSLPLLEVSYVCACVCIHIVLSHWLVALCHMLKQLKLCRVVQVNPDEAELWKQLKEVRFCLVRTECSSICYNVACY